MTDFVGNGCFLQKIGYNYIKVCCQATCSPADGLMFVKRKGKNLIFNSLTFIFLCFIPCILCILAAEKAGGAFPYTDPECDTSPLFSAVLCLERNSIHKSFDFPYCLELCSGTSGKTVQSLADHRRGFESGRLILL